MDEKNDYHQNFQVLLEKVKKMEGGDPDLLLLAFEFAEEAHQGQVRASGEPYIVHSIATAQKLADMNLDSPTIIAGLLHDVPEDTEITIAEIKKNFGPEISSLVAGITKLGTIKYRGMERYAENLRKMFIAMSDDIRVILIKFADRLHNLKTLDALPRDKQLRIARESLDIYAPIADRLGIGQIKGEIEDLAFKYVYPKEFEWITTLLPAEYASKNATLEKVKKNLTEAWAGQKPPIEAITINGRTKHLYSLYKKLLRSHIDRDLSKVHDLIALRVIVPTIGDCYLALGIIHNLYRPMPGRVKDYIAQPKPNGYQSLHTSIFTDEGEIVEVQIRTKAMHEEAEYGIAAHWHYKEKARSVKMNDKQVAWINELVKWQKEITDNEQFLQNIQVDIFQDRIFVFSPKGDVIDLPDGANPVDFAYHVHTSLGNKCVGARVNGQLVSLEHKLKSGDVVEIIIDKNRKGPNPDWLETVKTTMAKSKIKSSLNKYRQ